MGVFPSCSHVSTTVWLHHLNPNETIQEKARWELNKAAACSFEQILVTAPYKIVVVWPLISHLTNHPHKMS